jgi:tetratricopeptide (TPR) repeat protein
LTRILQEKAEELKKQRQSAEAAVKEVEEQLDHLDHLGITPPGAADKLQGIKELQRRSDWEAVETQAKALLTSLAKTVPASFEERRQRTVEALDRLSGVGVTVAPEVAAELAALAHPPAEEPWSTTAGRLLRAEEALRKAEIEHVTNSRDQALRVAHWAGLTPDRLSEFEQKLDEAVRPAREGRLAESMDQIGRLLREDLPEAVERRRQIREMASTLAGQAKEHGAPTSQLEAALDAGADARPEAWPDTVPRTEKAANEVGEALREKCIQSLEGLRTSLTAAAEYGADPGPAQQTVEEAIVRIRAAPMLEVANLFVEARRTAEEPVVSVIAGLLDEVRPRISEARRLGRDPSEVFASMNRAREALRLKIYSEAFAASQEALDRVSRLTEDLESVRDEFQAIEEMVGRFGKVGFSTESFEPAIERIRTAIERTEVAPAREALKGIVTQLGRDALQFFLARWAVLDKMREYARGRGFLTPEIDRGVTESRELLDRGEIAGSAERIAQSEVELRTAASPYVARRVEEMEQGLADIPDETLTSPVRRLLADADVSLRVKEDLPATVESLRRAEREFAAVFAAHASSLVEVLEAEGRVLESMGGASDEIQRQIDEVQQIFNMGDFVKASRSSQEIRTRAQQQQLLRSEEAVSHAKLSMVELETMGLDLAKFRSELDEAQASARAGRYLDAFQRASRLEETGVHARAAAQQILDAMTRAQETLGRLGRSGIDPGPFHDALREARLAFQSLQFDQARASLEGIEQKLGNEEARLETSRLLVEVEQLIEDGRRLSSPMEPFMTRWKQLKTEEATASPEATRTALRLLHEELVAILRPVLEENLRALERDLDIARAAGVNVEKILAPLGEARRRVALPVPSGAAALLDAARTEFVSTRGFVEQADRVAKRAREALAQADLLHVEAVALRGGMDRLDQLLGQQQYARVIELGGPLERELLQATYQHVSKTLAGFQATVSRMRRSGTDTSLAENLLHQARTALDEGRPVEALQLASKSEAEVERAELQRRIAEGSIEAVTGALGRMVSDGIVAPIAAEEFEAAKVAFQQRAYPDVLERAMTALDALGIAREGHRRAREALQTAERQVGEAVEHSANATDASARLAEARHFLEKGLYSESVRAARESTEMGRWAIERLFAAPLGELRRQVESARKEGLTSEIDPLDAVVSDAEAALRARDWNTVREGIQRAEAASRRMFESVVDGRWREVEADYARSTSLPPAEAARREEAKRQLVALRERRDFGAALGLVRGEHEVARKRWREELEARMAGFKDRLWVGERLGVDTTPVMQTFSEARVAIDTGRLDSAEAILHRATVMLEPAIREPFGRRQKELQTEVTFAQEGLHVSVGAVRERLKEVEELDLSGHILDAARLLLKTEEELNLRKSLHRELMNLHYLIDAAIGRAIERHLDTTAARALLNESIRLRETDYPAALEKAREALRTLQEEGAVAPEPSAAAPVATPFWPFRRPPSEP